MNLSKLPETKAWRKPDRTTLLKMCARFNVDPKGLPKNHVNLSELERYRYYMRCITGHSPCPICNGPQKQERHRGRGAFSAFTPQGIVCADHPTHTIAYNMAVRTIHNSVRTAKIEVPEGKELDEVDELNDLGIIVITRMLGKVCEHGYYLADCKDCIEVMNAQYEVEQERIEKVVINAELNEMSPVPA